MHKLAVKRDTYIAELIKSATNVSTATAKTEAAVKEAIDDAIVAQLSDIANVIKVRVIK